MSEEMERDIIYWRSILCFLVISPVLMHPKDRVLCGRPIPDGFLFPQTSAPGLHAFRDSGTPNLSNARFSEPDRPVHPNPRRSETGEIWSYFMI